MIPRHLLTALTYLGEKEIEGEKDNPIIARFLASVGIVGHDEIPWCAAFVNYCLMDAGMHGTNLGLAKSYLTWGRECGCEAGAVAIMNRGSDPRQGHVAFVVQDCGSYCITVGGNQSDAVTLAIVNKTKIISYRRTVWI